MDRRFGRSRAGRVASLLVVVGLLQGLGVPSAMATGYVVNSTADPGDGTCDGSCTLRDAILASNASVATLDTITFDASLNGMTIAPASALPVITDPVDIDGDTDAGAGVSPIVLSGASAGGGVDGLGVTAGGSTIENLVVNGFDGRGIVVQTAGGVTLSNLIVGLDAAGTSDVGNGDDGIELLSSTNVVENSVISGNGGSGIRIAGGSFGHTVSGNLIGTSSTGNDALGNDAFGVEIEGAVSATGLGPGNVISGNGSHGISILGLALNRPTDIRVMGNHIGIGLDGATDVGNGKDGIYAENVGTGSLIGGETPAARNVISGNGENADPGNGYGVQLRVSVFPYTLSGNFIGTDATGTVAVGNLRGGALVQGTSSRVGGTVGVTPGGSCTGECNLISGNASGGLSMSASGSAVVEGNYVGTDVTGTLDLGNAGHGVSGGASGGTPTIGGGTAAARNVIAGNAGSGISISDVNANQYTIQGNSIGVGSTGVALGNDAFAVFVGGDRNLIGGTGAGEGNVIANNGGGIFVLDSGGTVSQDNRILGNAIRDNVGLGIDLAPAGVTANDEDDPDGGANGRQNFPVVTGAFVGNGNTFVGGTLNSTPGETFRIEAFASPACDGTGFGEGAAFIGAADMPTQGSGDGSFGIVAAGGAAAGDAVTATATGPGGFTAGGEAHGNTSEFSECILAVADGDAPAAAVTDLGGAFTLVTPFQVMWSGDDGAGSGVDSFDVTARQATHKQSFGAPMLFLDDTFGTATAYPGVPGRTVCLSVAATDRLGQTGPDSVEECVAVPLDDRGLKRAGGFEKKPDPAAYRDTISQAKTKGATLTLKGARADRVALVFDRCPKCGKVRVSFAGAGKVVNTKGTNKDQRLVMLFDRPSAAKGKLVIRSLSDRMVRIDGVGLSAV